MFTIWKAGVERWEGSSRNRGDGGEHDGGKGRWRWQDNLTLKGLTHEQTQQPKKWEKDLIRPLIGPSQLIAGEAATKVVLQMKGLLLR